MDRRTVGMKNPGCCREVAVSGGLTVLYFALNYILSLKLLHFALKGLLHFASKVITFCIESYYTLHYYYILCQLLQFVALSPQNPCVPLPPGKQSHLHAAKAKVLVILTT